MSGDHECVFVEEREPSGRLILAPCLVCEVSALDALDQVHRERDAARADVEARVRAQVAAEIDADVSLFADIERLAAGDNPSTAAEAIQDAVAARIARGAL